jgi:hypothetical protein
MKRLSVYLTESLLLEGGNVWDNSASIKKENIKPTLDAFKKEFARLFPAAAKHFGGVRTLGSVGKKDVSGDIDLAMDKAAFTDTDDWGLDKARLTALYAQFKKRARSASDEQLMKRAVIVAIAEIVNEKSDLIRTDVKSAGNGTLFCQFPQYDNNGQLDISVQIDVNIGDIDWLTFAYYSDSYKGNVKGLHRTQLMLSLFSYKGYTFSHNYGVKNKVTQEIVSQNPEEAIDVLNKEYKWSKPIDQDTLSNYFKLQEFLQKYTGEEELNQVYNTFLKILDSTRCDIPEDLQEYWVRNQDTLGLTGKFLPNTSNLYPLKK